MNKELLPFFVFSVLIIFAIIFGRLFCGKVCPIGYIQEFVFKIPFPIKIGTFKLDKYIRLLKYIFFLLCFILSILTLFGFFTLNQNDDHAGPPIFIFVLLGISILSNIIIRRPFCKYFCPYGTGISLFNKISLHKYKIDIEKCNQCGICVKKCKMNIIPYKNKNVLECIRCGYCKKLCPKKAITTGFK